MRRDRCLSQIAMLFGAVVMLAAGCTSIPPVIEKGDRVTGAKIALLLQGATVYGAFTKDSHLKFVEHYGPLGDTTNYWAQISRTGMLGETDGIEHIQGFWYKLGNLICYQYVTPLPHDGCTALYVKDGGLRFVDPTTNRVESYATRVERRPIAAAVVRKASEEGERASFPTSPSKKISLKMQKRGGIYAVPVTINNSITLDFVIDSGAADVTIPSNVVMALMKSGTLLHSDFLTDRTYTLADGSKMPSTTIRIRSLKLGDIVVENVRASVSPLSGALLLGQSFLGRLKSWSVDNEKHIFVAD
jgi:clan AA aspartic protease (TIGR02281 family)